MVNKYRQVYPRNDSVVISKLIYDDGELRIQGFDRDASLVLELIFQDVLVVRISDEGVRLRLLEELGAVDSLVIVTEKSALSSWVLEESLNTRDMKQGKHFVVLMGEEIYDVVSFVEPQMLTTPLAS